MHMTTAHITLKATWIHAARLGIACLLALGPSIGEVAIAQDDPPPPHPARGPEPVTALLPSANEGVSNNGPMATTEGIQSVAGRLAFQSLRDGNWEVYAAHDDGVTALTRLTADPAADVEPRLSPDTNWIVFSSKRSGNYDLWVINVNGSGLRQLTNDPASDSAPAWSPDGTKIAFASDRGSNIDVYVINVDGSGLTRLTTQAGYDGEPTWSPDGTQIAFVSKRTSGAADYYLYTMTPQGGAQTLRSPMSYVSRPTWSPDGAQILFDAANAQGWQRLYLYTVASSATQPVDLSGIYAANYDVWAGSWGLGAQAFATVVSYVLYQGTWYIEYLSILTVDTVARTASGINSNRRDGLPDWRNADTLPPITSLAPTNPYVLSNVNGIGISGTIVDQGIAGVDRIETQYKFATGDWQASTLSCFMTLPTFGCLGWSPMQDVQIRARGVDRMGNAEAWPTDPNQWVTQHRYRLRIDGQVTDQRGLPLTNVPLIGAPTIDPNPATRSDGRYRLYVRDLPAPIVFTMTAALPGGATSALRPYSLEALSLGYGQGEAIEDFRLRQTDQVLADPSFDTPQSVWAAADGLAPQWVAAQLWPPQPTRMQLGWGDRLWSLATGQMPPVVATNPSGGFMAVVADMNQSSTFVSCSDDALCATPEPLGTGYPLALGLSPNGTAAYLAQTATDQVTVRFRSPAGVWSDAANFPSPVGTSYRLLADSGNAWHAVWTGPTNRVLLSHRNPDGTWTAALDTGEGFYQSTAVFDHDGRLHMPRCMSSGVIDMTWSVAEGLLGPTALSPDTCYNRTVQVTLVDDAGAVYYAWTMGGDLKVRRQSPVGVITTIAPVDYGTYETVGVVAGQGGRPALILQAWNGQGLSIAQLTPGATWDITPLNIPGADAYKMWTYLSWRQGAGRLLAIRTDLHTTPPVYTVGELGLSAVGDTSAVSKALILSPSIHRPLLSLEYRQEDPAATVTVQVETAPGGSATHSQTLPAGTGWQHAWLDLSSFAGQAITLTVQVQGPAGTWPVADLDEITLGSWTTPLVTSISPAVLDGPSGVVTLIGDNFIGTPAVTIGGLPASVSVVDEQHLSVTLPGGLGYGRHAVVVTNPDGFATTSSQPVQAGHDLLFIPALLRLIPGGWTTYFP